MSENAIILGAGASYDAGIPLLGNFMDVMVRMANTKRAGKRDLSEEDSGLLSKAVGIREKLEGYHARVAVDQFNIEEVLSVLSFESISGDRRRKRDLDDFTRAIGRVVELTCGVTHSGKLNVIQESGPYDYRRFWLALLSLCHSRLVEIPTILSFNYDLVLERALFQVVVGHQHSEIVRKLGVQGFYIDYCNDHCEPVAFRFKQAAFIDNGYASEFPRQVAGIVLEQFTYDRDNRPEGFLRIPILKLHGSLNFPNGKADSGWHPLAALSDPKIIPPIFNKTGSAFAAPIWKEALRSLRECRNLSVCGYSLPVTDTYMQYFLKAALGPNKSLNRVFVFDPCLSNGSDAGRALRNRYAQCFSAPLQQRIDFDPGNQQGTFSGMVELLASEPDVLLDGLSPVPDQEEQYQAVELVRRVRRDRMGGL
ncbi:hypothetical protein [Luteolibacter luteus]|uniref:SIR2-like domain-containing protein n=1 Tax=Luteolibacter luteus TaxID=2728835 RepID=A0A858RPE2_9BACT|nr:hypothetical protein [Luteolibacter luteus]QJE97990.1 hypothetical protein HHL09_20090 [Luteolibacter luteus]